MCLLVCRCTTQTRCPPLSAARRPGVQRCHKLLAKERQRALTPVRMADVHTTRQGGTRGHRIGLGWLVEVVPPGHGRKQTEAFLTWAAGCTRHSSTSHKLRATLKADKIEYELILVVNPWSCVPTRAFIIMCLCENMGWFRCITEAVTVIEGNLECDTARHVNVNKNLPVLPVVWLCKLIVFPK